MNWFRRYFPNLVSIANFLVLIYFVWRPPTTNILLWWIAFILAWIFAIRVA